MADIELVYPHGLSKTHAKAVAQKVADQLGEEYQLQTRWEDDTLHFHRRGVAGHICITDRCIQLQVELGLLLSFYRDVLERHIEVHLAQALASPGNADGC